MCVGVQLGSMHAAAHLWRSEDNLGNLFSPFASQWLQGLNSGVRLAQQAPSPRSYFADLEEEKHVDRLGAAI